MQDSQDFRESPEIEELNQNEDYQEFSDEDIQEFSEQDFPDDYVKNPDPELTLELVNLNLTQEERENQSFKDIFIFENVQDKKRIFQLAKNGSKFIRNVKYTHVYSFSFERGKLEVYKGKCYPVDYYISIPMTPAQIENMGFDAYQFTVVDYETNERFIVTHGIYESQHLRFRLNGELTKTHEFALGEYSISGTIFFNYWYVLRDEKCYRDILLLDLKSCVLSGSTTKAARN